MSSDNTLLISQDTAGSFKKYYLATLGANLAAFTIGTGLGYCSPALYSLNQSNSRIHLNTWEQAWFGAIVPLAALIGGLVSGKTIECYGRKFTLMFGSVPMIVAWLIIIYSYNVEELFIGRFITGFSIGLLNVAGPVYIAETTPAKVRGLFGLSFPLTMALGVVYSYYIGYLKTWSYLAFYCSVIPAAQLLFMFYLPETPAWLIKHDQVDVATETVFWLYGEDHNLLSVALLTNNENDSDGKLKLLLTEPRYRQPFLLCVALMFFQQFSGINAVIFYTANILESAKSSIDPNTATIYIGLTQFLTVLISCALVDRFGRKLLLYVSGFLMGIAMMIFSLYYFYVSDEVIKTYGWVPLFALILYTFSYAIGYGPLPWLIMSELLQTKVKGLASGLVVSSNFFFFFLITWQFKNLSEVLEEKYIYLGLSLISFSSVLFTFFFLFESKGKSLAEIEEYYRQRNPTANQSDA